MGMASSLIFSLTLINFLFHRYIPGWFTVNDKTVIEGFYSGGGNLYTTRNLKAWLLPFLTWGSLTFFLCFIMLCMNLLLRKRWDEVNRDE